LLCLRPPAPALWPGAGESGNCSTDPKGGAAAIPLTLGSGPHLQVRYYIKY